MKRSSVTTLQPITKFFAPNAAQTTKKIKLNDVIEPTDITKVNNEITKDEQPPKQIQINSISAQAIGQSENANPFGIMMNNANKEIKTWEQVIAQEQAKPYYKNLQTFIKAERAGPHKIFPPEEDVLSWSRHCPLDQVRVVILGQDPYHGPNQAHGLCFSVRKGIPVPPSLANIYKELSTDIADFTIPRHGNLIGWSRQGVLLLNSCLTVRQGQANSHKDKGWETFTTAILNAVNSLPGPVVFLLWGSPAQKKMESVRFSRHHDILRCAHPSPLSAHRGFFGCKHFSAANAILKKNGAREIKWQDIDADYT